ncbi:hypothetical protein A3844_04315 [Paenibacillus helianthi]|uniref:Radical SAM core domain-containing protein n=1 Tax=Paenibacillus helianthi TaxID=1349432 RepID=A0ABX3EVT2_9BACL|nr:radical SAM protein [Paenibacillus helianthi]OKP91072.1 hypothetical protein A3844_04315 [Paenibacillus helianthi]
MPKYLFIRILEACNAGCFMCNFRSSQDEYRLGVQQYIKILHKAKKEGLEYIRFTGGEPLLHENIIDFIKIAKDAGIQSSIITNGYYLAEKAELLGNAGLSQIIVSIDGSSSESHNRFRNTPGLFDSAVKGLKLCQEFGIHTRVNTVAGVHNFGELISVQKLLSDLGVEQWELSALKLDHPLKYSAEVIERIISDLNILYKHGPEQGQLKPLGKQWCGEGNDERERFFESGITPTPDNCCTLVHHMRFYDPKNGYLFPCSLLPHRIDRHITSVKMDENNFSMISDTMMESSSFFSKKGPNICTGCSSTAAGFIPNEEVWNY